MTELKNGCLIVRTEDDQECDYCGGVSECRPYGRNGAEICFDCAMLNEKETEEAFSNLLGKAKVVVVAEGTIQ